MKELHLEEIILNEMKSLEIECSNHGLDFERQKDAFLRSLKFFPCPECGTPLNYIKKELKCSNCAYKFSVDSPCHS